MRRVVYLCAGISRLHDDGECVLPQLFIPAYPSPRINKLFLHQVLLFLPEQVRGHSCLRGLTPRLLLIHPQTTFTDFISRCQSCYAYLLSLVRYIATPLSCPSVQVGKKGASD
jgi:hypothetical protein